MTHRLPTAVSVALAFATCAACFESVSVYSTSNLELYRMPRSSALAVSDLAFSRDGTVNSNPAVLALDSTSELALSYSEFYWSFGVSNVSFVAPSGRDGALGVSLGYLLVPNIPINAGWALDDNDQYPIVPPESERRYESASEVMFHAAYGRKLAVTSKVVLSAGIGLNGMRRRLPLENGGYSAGYGTSADAGVAVHFPKLGTRLALLGRNLSTSYMRWSSAYHEHALPNALFAVGWQRDIEAIRGCLRVSFTSPDLLSNSGPTATTYLWDGDSAEAPVHRHYSKDPQYLLYGNYGVELFFAQRVSLRLGLGELRYMAFGAGVGIIRNRLYVDFAHRYHQLAWTHAASLAYRWD